MHAQPKIHFVIANGDHARCVERGEHGFITLHEMSASEHYAPDHPRRVVQESATSARHGGNEVDVQGRRREDFARELAEHLSNEAKAGKFERLALVAPARMLGALRDALTEPARSKLVKEISKDLTKVANHDLDEWLRHPDLA